MTTENKQQESKKTETKEEPKKDWMEYINDLAKNPIAGLGTGLAVGYMLGEYKNSNTIKEIKEEYKKQTEDRDKQFLLIVEQMQLMNKHLAASIKTLPEKEIRKTLEMEKDPEQNSYRYKLQRKQYKLK